MTGNLLEQKLADGGPLFGAYISFPSPDVVEYCGYAGFDWVFLDAEHTPIGVELCQSLVRAADAAGIPAVVRVPRNEPATILGYAESGASALMAPHIASPAAARQFVEAVRFWPNGTRGASSTSRAARYGLASDARTYFLEKDRQPKIVALLEDEPAFAVIPEIAAVPGIDMFFIGPGDLAMSMGLPGEASHARVAGLIAEAMKVLTDEGKIVGTVAGSPEGCRQAVDQGFRLLVVSVGALLGASIRRFLADVREEVAPAT